MRYTDIFWDFDGTLYSTYVNMIGSCKKAVVTLGGRIDDEEELVHACHVSMPHAFAFYGERFGIDPLLLRAEYDRLHKTAMFADDLSYPGLCDLLRKTSQAGIRHHICSHRWRQSCVDYFTRDGIADLFYGYATPDLDLARKPSPEMVEYLLRTENLDSERCLMVGDRSLDILSAANAGVDGCLFTPEGWFGPEEKPTAVYYAETVEELEKVLFS